MSKRPLFHGKERLERAQARIEVLEQEVRELCDAMTCLERWVDTMSSPEFPKMVSKGFVLKIIEQVKGMVTEGDR